MSSNLVVSRYTGHGWHATMNSAARENLIPLTAVLIPLYLISGFFRARFLGTLSDWIVVAEFTSAALTIVLLWLILRYDPRGRLVHPMLFLVAMVATGDSMLQLYKSHSGWDTTNLALVIAATGLVSLSVVASAAIYSIIWLGWLGCVWLYPGGEWQHFGFFLLWTTGIAIAVQAARSRLLRRLYLTETQQREKLEQVVRERTWQLEKSLEHLRHVERLASVGTFAAGIAHEINNPVGMMLLSAEQMLLHPDMTDESLSRQARDIIKNARRCGQIVKNVLRFAQHEAAERTIGDVNAVVRSAVDFAHNYAVQQGGEIQCALTPELPPVSLSHIELEQALVNLIQNGIEAASERVPQITVTTARAADMVRIVVVDNGCGIPPQDRSRVFDPFFTTRRTHGGTGLGLSLVYGIIADHGGTVRIESTSNDGTEMTIDLPIYSVPA